MQEILTLVSLWGNPFNYYHNYKGFIDGDTRKDTNLCASRHLSPLYVCMYAKVFLQRYSKLARGKPLLISSLLFCKWSPPRNIHTDKYMD